MREDLRELWKFRELLHSMVRRELQVRYKGTVIGFFWSFINPLATMVVLTVVFKYIMQINIPNYSAYLLAALLPYFFFQQAILDCAQSIHSGMSLVKKVYFPREILPLSIIISNFIHFLLALCVFFAFLLVIYLMHPAVSPFQTTIVLLPLLLITNLAMVTGFGLYFAALNTFYEDVKYFLTIVLQLLFYLCPIVYFVEMVHHRLIDNHPLLYALYNLNPIGMQCIAFRKLMLAPQQVVSGAERLAPMPLDWRYLAVSAAFSFFMLWYGYHKFNQMKWKFVERP